MYNNSKIAMAIRLAMMFGATTAAAISAPAFAAEEGVERIQVTGSSIKRTDIEGALPIMTISADDIIKSGVTSVPELVATLPAMQGFTTASDSVGGGGGGVQSASLRGLGDQYTLVLLNGRRMASSDTGGVVDLNQIPLSAIKRVEVLMDGASSLYGSDAITGVVNFILKDDVQETTFDIRMDKPQEKGAESFSFSLSTGFGDVASDGYNIMFAYSHNEQKPLKSKDRDFAKTGILDFTYNDKEYTLVQGSANAGPGNAYLSFLQYNDDGSIKKQKELDDDGNETGGYTDKNDLRTRNFNPFREKNGACGVNNAPEGSTCKFDYTSTLEVFPETSRDNIFVQGIAELSDSAELYSSVAWSSFKMETKIAPYPTGGFDLVPTSQLVKDEILPHLTDDETAALAADPNYLDKVVGRWRVLPGGNRTDAWETDTLNFTTGLRGEVSEFNYDVAATYASATRDQNRITGYPIQATFLPLIKSGRVNVFDEFDNLSEEQNQLIKDTMYSGGWESTDTSLLSLEGRASTLVAELPAGDMYVGFGADYREQEFTRRRSQANSDAIILFEVPTTEFDLSRETYGAFVEAIVPVWDTLEVTAAIRYDNVGGVTDHDSVDVSGAVNDDQDDTTYKLSATYRPNDDWLVRASFGTGFKAATMNEIATPREDFGVTSGSYACPKGLRASLVSLCEPENFQYQVWREGNIELKPETSEQMSAGFLYAPTNDFSFGLDYWSVDLEEQVTRLEEAQIFGDAVTYDRFFTTKPNLGTGGNDLAIIQAAVNIGKSENSGIDWVLNMNTPFSFGTLSTTFLGTYMLKSKSLRSGTTDQWDSSLGRFGSDNSVVFDVQAQINNTLTIGDFDHTLNINYKSGYEDQLQTDGSVRLGNDISTNAPDIQLYVPAYWKLDYLTRYNANENTQIVFGITNLLDQEPSLSLRTGGAGHQVGYDPRYVDVKGRTFYLGGTYTF